MESFRRLSTLEWVYMLHPRPVAIIVSGLNEDNYSAMAASWVMPVSRQPPILAVAIAPSRYTWSFIEKTGEFAVCMLDWRYVQAVDCLGSVSGREVKDKIRHCGLSKGKARKIKAPIILEAYAVAECRVKNVVDTGDHKLVVAEVIEAYARNDVKLCPHNVDAVLHVCRGFYAKPSGIQEV